MFRKLFDPGIIKYTDKFMVEGHMLFFQFRIK